MRAKAKQHVYFVDDEPGIRKVVSDDLQRLGCKVSCFASAESCLKKLPDGDCNLLITDVKMPGMDGLTLLRQTRRIAPWVSVMVITGFGDIPMAVRALKLGAVDFIEKPLDRKAFLGKIRLLLHRDDFAESSAGKSLTKTEKKILKLILDGKSNKEMAYVLQRAIRTVELHRSHIMHKFDVDSIVDLVKKTALLDLAGEG